VNLRVLGCSGGSARGRHPTSFLIDGRIAIDAGAVTANLSPEEQERVDHVVLSHAHLDHVANLPFLLDNRFARQTRPIRIYGPAVTLKNLRGDLFNNRVWPDFTTLHNRKSISLETIDVTPGVTFEIENLKLTADSMVHPVPCHGYRIDDGENAIYIAGDTGDVEPVKRAVRDDPRIRAIVIEVSWPNRMSALADISGHLVPRMLAEAWPLHPSARVMVTHIKPFHFEEVEAEIVDTRLPGIEILADGMSFDF